MAFQIRKAVRERVWLKIVGMGPAGSGKTYGLIGVALGIASNPSKVLVVDTENSSASYYADKFSFDVVDLHAPFSSQKYLDILQEAVRLGYEVIVFDSLSHEWAASGGVLDKKGDLDRQKGEKWGNWQDAKKPHSIFKEAWLQAPIHVLATMRSKMEYVLETNEKGRQVPRKVGLAPIQDGDSEYEFGVAFEIDRDSHLATASKDRTGLFDGRSFMLNEAIGRELLAWRDGGAELRPESTGATTTPEPAPATVPKPVAAPTPAPAVAQPRPTRAAAAPSAVRTPPAAPAPSPSEPPAEWVVAMAELAAVTVGMPEPTRKALVASFEAEGPSALPALREEIAIIQGVMKPESAGEVFTTMDRPANPEPSQAASDFVDGIADGPEGAITAVQYEALGQIIGAFKVDRDCLRSYMVKAGHLLPSNGHPTLARMKAEEFAKLREKLFNQAIAAKNETWSARTVRIINATPKTTYQPIPAGK